MMRFKRYGRLLFIAALATEVLFCQRGPTPVYEDTNKSPVSPEVRADQP